MEGLHGEKFTVGLASAGAINVCCRSLIFFGPGLLFLQQHSDKQLYFLRRKTKGDFTIIFPIRLGGSLIASTLTFVVHKLTPFKERYSSHPRHASLHNHKQKPLSV